ncbi:MAG TPA: terminase small subunit [Patescibacteria group bacterium]|nr:terminase small subunit [Patescibacteria group bacterium]
MSDQRELTAKEQRFCCEHLIDGNGSRAAIRAGYAVKSARVTASQLLTKPNIQAELERLRKQSESDAIATHDEVCRMLTNVIRCKLAHYVRPDGSVKLEDLTSPGVQEVTIEDTPAGQRVRVKLRDPVGAAHELANMRGYHAAEKHQVSGRVRKEVRFFVRPRPPDAPAPAPVSEPEDQETRDGHQPTS